MSHKTELFALNLDQIAKAIKANGHKRTMLVQGHMGTGKSSLLKNLSADLPNHMPCYFDCTTKDLGDITIPDIAKLNDGTGFVTYLTNEELGAHSDKPIILMIDEYGKANPAVKNALLRLMLERKIGSYTLHPESIVFATTNLGNEGVGDLLPPHARNRMTVITSRKPTATEWIEWGIQNGVEHTMLSWVKDNPHVMQSFEEVRDPESNPYIYHPQQQRAAFVTPRSLEAGSDWLKMRDALDEQTVKSVLIGTIGERAALDMMAYVSLADDLPSLDSIKKDPMAAKIPESAAATCMVVFRTLANIEKDWVDAWMEYMGRLDMEAQGMFANGIRSPKFDGKKQSAIMTNKKFTQWAMANNYMFSADKK